MKKIISVFVTLLCGTLICAAQNNPNTIKVHNDQKLKISGSDIANSPSEKANTLYMENQKLSNSNKTSYSISRHILNHKVRRTKEHELRHSKKR